jgi:hypothetical protein
MLPKNRLRWDMLNNLKVFREDHDMTDILPNVEKKNAFKKPQKIY